MILNISRLQTNNSNSTANTTRQFYSDEINITIICICCLILLIGVTGNALVCLYLGQRNLCKKTDIFLISLALADLLATLTGSSDNIITYSFKYTNWELNGITDTSLQIVTITTLAVSSWTLTVIAFDRYWAITRPFESYRITDKIRIIISLLIWLTAATSTAIFTFSEKIGIKGDPLLILIGTMVFLAWVLPISSITTLYAMCIRKLRRKNKNNPCSTIGQRNKENKRVVKMFIVVTIAFFVSIFPASLVSIIFLTNDEGGIVYLARECAYILMTIGSAVNPFIYAKMHREIHGALVRIWKVIRRVHGEYSNREEGQAKCNEAYEMEGNSSPYSLT